MAEILTLKEMKHRYYGEWLLVACTEIDDQLNTICGEVIIHSLDRDTIYDAITAYRHTLTGTLAIEYVGDIPEGWAAILGQAKLSTDFKHRAIFSGAELPLAATIAILLSPFAF